MKTINTGKFIKVIASEGCVITTDAEGSKVTNYFSEGALPLSFDLSVLREVPISEISEPEE
jgi:hypothetical protein